MNIMKKNNLTVLLLTLFLVSCNQNPSLNPSNPSNEEISETPTSEVLSTIEPTSEEVSSEEPTTEEISTEEPTTEEPTTEEPTTEEPVDPYEGYWTYDGDNYSSLDLSLTDNDLKLA